MTAVLLIDNYDSFTYNLFQLLGEAAGEAPSVVRNDAIPRAAIERGEFDGIVISPGPGRPDVEADFGGCADVIRECDLPILGVCLGHQGIATAFGGSVTVTEPVHGRAGWISHDGSEIFAGLPERFEAIRYHSLVVAGRLPDCLRATAWSDDGALMALEHAERPIRGVQFHPESAGTAHGRLLIENFVKLTEERASRSGGRRPPVSSHFSSHTADKCELGAGEGRVDQDGSAAPAPVGPPMAGPPTHRVVVRTLRAMPDPAAVFTRLFSADRFAFWIDREPRGGGPGAGQTIMGSAATPGSEVLTYDVASRAVEARSPAEGVPDRIAETIFEVLRRRLGERRISPPEGIDFAGGYVGYLGYELKSDLGSPGRHSTSVPDACLVYSSRFVVLDHAAGEAHAIRVVGPGEDLGAAEAEAESTLRELELKFPGDDRAPEGSHPTRGRGSHGALDHDRYLEAIAEAQRHLRAGDSYEICLTNRIDVEVDRDLDPLAMYLRLRDHSPAPQAAYLRLGDVAVLSASPERFLRIDRDRRVRTSPIKGTRPRSADPDSDRALRDELLESAKEQAENLMIVDVLRNDLGRVCEIGSVEVRRLMEVQSFAQVHQLVSTIEGRLAPGHGPIGCVEACFPGGSMTGAPKLRTMEILDSLEPVGRGPYSGALGYFGLGGEVDLSIVIRSIVIADGLATVGAGGAITALSDPEAEWAEMLLKAQPLLDVLGPSTRSGGAGLRDPEGRA